jgi:hypothetical protein
VKLVLAAKFAMDAILVIIVVIAATMVIVQFVLTEKRIAIPKRFIALIVLISLNGTVVSIQEMQ